MAWQTDGYPIRPSAVIYWLPLTRSTGRMDQGGQVLARETFVFRRKPAVEAVVSHGPNRRLNTL